MFRKIMFWVLLGASAGLFVWGVIAGDVLITRMEASTL